MRSFKKFLIACGLCLGAGLAFGTSEVKAAIPDVTFTDMGYDPSTRTYKVKLEDDNPDPIGKDVELYFDGEHISTINTLTTPVEYTVPEDKLIELVVDNINDGSYTPSMRVEYGAEGDEKKGEKITPFSLEINCEYSDVTITNTSSAMIYPLPSTVDSESYFYSLDSAATVSLNASPKSGYTFTRWDISPSGTDDNPSISAVSFSSGGTTYFARSGKIDSFDFEGTQIKKGNSATAVVKKTGTVSTDDFDFSVDSGAASINPATDKMSAVITANSIASSVKAQLSSAKYLSTSLVKQFDIVDTPVVTLSNNILTAGEKMNLSLVTAGGVSNVNPGGADSITWKEGESTITDNIFSSGSFGTHTLTPTVTYGSTSMVGAPVTITVYPYPTLELDKDDDEYELTVKVPEAAGSGNTSLNPVKKYKLYLVKGSKIIGYYPDVDSCFVTRKDDELTIDNDDLEEFIQDVAKKKQSLFDDKEKIEVRFVLDTLTDSSNKTIDGIENESDSFSIYRVTVLGDNAETKYYYGLKNQKIKISPTMKSGATFDSWEDGNKDNPRSITISSDTDKNKYRVIATGKASTTASTAAVTPTTPTTPSGTAGGNTNLDKVPKTGEGNAILWVLMVSVITIIGAGSAVYYKMKAPKKAEVNYEAQVRDVTFANPEALMQEKLNRRNNDSSRRK